MHAKALIGIVVTTVAVQAAAQEVVKVHNWADYIDPAVVQDFERETGIRVDYTTYTTAAQLEADLDSGERFDVIVPADSQLDRLIKENRLAPLDFRELPNRAEVSRDLLLRLNSRTNADLYAIPYMWGTVGLVVHERAASQALQAPVPNSWSVLFDPASVGKLKPCGVMLQDEPEQALSLYLNYRGQSLRSSNARSIRKAIHELRRLELSPSPQPFTAFISQLAEGKVCAAMAWSGLVSLANEKGELRYSIPEEGSLLFIDSLAIPGNAGNVPAAYRFIDYLLRPENAVRNARASHFTPSLDLGRPGNRQLLPELATPTPEERRRLYIGEELSSDKKRTLDAAWAEANGQD
ncbi:extracellular solute-binding protein [Pseudomonas aeruginosa]|uniref:extracellular solute-binding protein n=1 Tax=Pseudomonas aeruginosa TaxID=287 RepID=UPI001A9529E2|nr:extracellular solute-binding protein [Pseudomonas aeruginosa]MBO0968692.1 extracellular solute-binding protein [Pseudomonas aeruginosa]MCV4103412.1 extracellular solute-binding protein [Pseudomonas aeruginosa]HEP9463088.1 extracellular solute-binding protein [Pseudomonas aeruginosa]